jgi:hypothetical protein
VGAVKGELEIPLLLSFLYLFSEAEPATVKSCLVLALSLNFNVFRRSALKTVSGGEFDWGGTSVKA